MTPQPNAATPRAGRREWTAFAVLLLPLLLVSMDVSVLYFAIPAITRELDPSSTQQLWIFDVYAFALAGLLITMGSLGDRVGRRRLLLIGAGAFGAASAVAAYAQSAETLIAARALLGIGGATLMPSTMALVRSLFRDDAQRTRAIGLWSGVMAGGVALGSVMGGVLLEHFWWGSVFLVNVPAMVLLLVLAPLLVPESKDPAPGRFDALSVPLSLGAVLPVVYGLKEIAVAGVTEVTAACLGAGLALGILFVRRQRARRDAMISRELFTDRVFGGGIALLTVASFAMMGSAYFSTQYLQSVLGMESLEAALWSLAPSAAIGAGAPAATMLAARLGRTPVVAGGFALAAAGFGLFALLDADSLALLLIGAGVSGIGIVTVIALVADLALSSAPQHRAGSAASLLETGQEFGGALGMAVLGSVGTAVYRDGLAGSLPSGLAAGALQTARETLGGAAAVAARLPGPTGEAVLSAARDAFVDGMRIASAGSGVLLLAAGVAAVLLLRGARAAAPGPSPVDPAPAPVHCGEPSRTQGRHGGAPASRRPPHG